MSATRDKDSKVIFLYENMLELYRKAKASNHSELREPCEIRHLQSPAPINPFHDLKNNIDKLHGLHEQLKKMIKELEDSLER